MRSRRRHRTCRPPSGRLARAPRPAAAARWTGCGRGRRRACSRRCTRRPAHRSSWRWQRSGLPVQAAVNQRQAAQDQAAQDQAARMRTASSRRPATARDTRRRGGLGGDAQVLADLAEALALTVEQTEAGLDGVAGPLVERAEQLVEQLAVDHCHHGVFRGAVAVGHQVAEGGVAIVADGLVQRHRRGEAVQFGVADVERLAVAGRLTQRSAQAGGAITGDADEAGLLVERTADGLADPEGGIGGELEATAPVELVDGVLEAEVAFLDQIQQVHALGQGITTGDGDHQSEVGTDEAVLGAGGLGHCGLEGCALLALGEPLGRVAAGFDDARQFALLLSIEEGTPCRCRSGRVRWSRSWQLFSTCSFRGGISEAQCAVRHRR